MMSNSVADAACCSAAQCLNKKGLGLGIVEGGQLDSLPLVGALQAWFSGRQVHACSQVMLQIALSMCACAIRSADFEIPWFTSEPWQSLVAIGGSLLPTAANVADKAYMEES
jgi:hypothetical protein